MDGHPVAEGGHLFREAVAALRAQAFGPLVERRPRRRVEARDLVVAELARQLDGREAGPVEDLVGGGVADAREQAWVGERALPGGILAREGGAGAPHVRLQGL